MKPEAPHERTHLRIGEVARPHGVRGELKVRLDYSESRALDDAEDVVLVSQKGDAQRWIIESVRGNSKGLILALEGVDSRERADELRGAALWVSRESQAPLEPGEYYLVDLVGCDVQLEGAAIGKVERVRPDPSVDTLVIALTDGSKGEVPIVDAWIRRVDVSARLVELTSEDGIIR